MKKTMVDLFQKYQKEGNDEGVYELLHAVCKKIDELEANMKKINGLDIRDFDMFNEKRKVVEKDLILHGIPLDNDNDIPNHKSISSKD